MSSRGFVPAFVALSLVLLAVSAAPANAQLGVWRDINPTAYISPPANPQLNSVYMLSSSEGWAVGDSRSTSNITTGLPAIFHYDGSTWNLVPAPKFPDFPSQQSAYNLTSISFGPPGTPINRNDGWTVGYNSTLKPCTLSPSQCTLATQTPNATALHWDGITWRIQTAGLSGLSAGPLWAVSMVSSTDAWAVGQTVDGTAGTFWHWTGVPGLGGGWNTPQASVPGTLFFSVFMVSSSEGWAVGSAGKIFHYFGGTWTSFPSPVSTTLRSVFMISPTEGWAVGDAGVIVHYASGIWTGPVSPGTTTNNLFSVFMVSSTLGWVGGAAGTILLYTGGSWTALPINLIPTSPTQLFRFASVFFNTASDGWGVGTAGVILHFDGANWGTVTSPTLNNFTSISFGPPLVGPANPNDGWAVGNSSTISPFEPTIYHWNGFMWTKGSAIGATNDLNSVYMLSTGDVWTVGGGPRTTASCSSTLCPVILHYTGGAWNTITPPPGSYKLKSVFMVSSTEGWAVGGAANPSAANGTILHYTVSGGVGSWGVFPGPATNGYGIPLPGLNSVFMLGPNEGWAVGDNQTILHYTVTGGIGTWNSLTVSGSPGLGLPLHDDANLTSIFMLSQTSGWAVGGIQARGSFSAGPVILYWDGSKWTPVAAPVVPGGISPTGVTSATLKSVYCSGPNDCWSGGLPGKLLSTLFHWDGVAWNDVTLSPALLGQDASFKGVPPILTSVYMISPTTGFIVGSSPGFTTIPTKALSTVLRFAPFGGIYSTTLTSTIVSTVTTSTSLLTSSTVSTITSLTSTTSTVVTTTNPPQGGIPGFPDESIIAGIILGLFALAILRRGRVKRNR